MSILDIFLWEWYYHGIYTEEKDKKYYKYDRETHTMEVMLQKSIIDKIFKNYL